MKNIAKQLKLVAVFLLAIVMMVGVSFAVSAEETGAETPAIDLSGVTWVLDGTANAPEGLVYTGEKYTIVLANLPSDVKVKYSGNTATNAGEYTAKAEVTYKVDGQDKKTTLEQNWSVAKATYDMSGVTYEDATVVYNGEVHKLEIKGELPKGVKVSYKVSDDKTCINVDTYTVTASFTGNTKNYEEIAPMTATLTIQKAVYDMSGVSFADKTLVYRGIAQSLAIDGKLPLGVRVSYSGSYSEVGSYDIVASFSGDAVNYELIPDMSAKLTIVPATPDDCVYTYKDSVGNVIVKVVSTNGIPADTLYVVDNSYLYDTIEISNFYSMDILTSYDLSFSFNGAVQTVSDKLTVTILIPEALRANDKLEIVHITEDGKVERIASERVGDTFVFETDHFSTFAFAEGYNTLAAEEESMPWWMILLFVLDGLSIAFFIVSLCVKPRPESDGDEDPTEEPVEEAAEEAPAEEPVEEAAEETPAEEPVEEAAEETPAEESVEEAAEETPAEEPVEEAAEETPAEEPVEEAAEETPAEEPVEEAAEETPAEEPVEEAAEETPAEETPAEESAEEQVIAPVVVSASDDEDVEKAVVDGQVVMVSYRSSFMSRLIQAETDIQDYYTVIKNTLLSYKGVKARTSWNYESFNKGRFQCAKLNIKGRTLSLYLALAPEDYSASKYHFSDVSGNGKFDKVPMMLKIRSDRALKYAVELIEELMKAHDIEAGPAQNVDYHMPYETTEALAARDLVKIIVPTGVSIGENDSLVKVDVSNVIGSGVSTSAVDTDKEIAQTLEQLKEAIPDEEVVHVDAQHADELLTDEEAKAQLEVITVESQPSTSNKFAEINLDTICENFKEGETVTLEKLKALGLVSKSAGKLKVLARGVMTERLVVIADKYSIQAVKMITLAGGHAEQIANN